jgi:sugar phosphate isomerase/epimerase
MGSSSSTGSAKRSARELGRDDWILSHFSLMGADFDSRLQAAAGAGFSAVGLLIPEYRKLLREGRSDADLVAALDRQGLVLAEVEALLGWAATGEARARAERHLEVACHMAEVFGSRHLQVIGPYEGSLDDCARAFGEVCDRAAESGLQVAIEFLPPNNIPDAGVALDIVERADRSNGGLCVDIWHHFRGARDDGLLRAIPGDRVVSIQLSDGTMAAANPNYIEDCMQHRVPTGQGEFDVAHFLGILDEIGATAPRSFEVISTELAALDPAEAARRIAEGARTL